MAGRGGAVVAWRSWRGGCASGGAPAGGLIGPHVLVAAGANASGSGSSTGNPGTAAPCSSRTRSPTSGTRCAGPDSRRRRRCRPSAMPACVTFYSARRRPPCSGHVCAAWAGRCGLAIPASQRDVLPAPSGSPYLTPRRKRVPEHGTAERGPGAQPSHPTCKWDASSVHLAEERVGVPIPAAASPAPARTP